VETSTVAVDLAAGLRLPPVPEPVSWPGGVPGVVPGSDASAVAAECLGDAALAPLLVPMEGGFFVPPGALRPAWRAGYAAAVEAQVAWSVREVRLAQDPAAAQAALLRGLESLPDPDAQADLLRATGRTLAGALEPAGPTAGRLLGARLAAEARVGPASAATLATARDALLTWMDDGGPAASAATRALLAEAPPGVQAVLLLAVAEAHDAPGLGPFARYGEPTPAHMLHRLMEGMGVEDRDATLDALAASGVLTAAATEALRAGRSAAGRLAPWLTHAAGLATEDYARWSEAGGGWGAALGGGLAALGTAEAVGDTVVALGTAGLGVGVSPALARLPTLAKGLMVAGTGLGAYQATLDLQAALTGRDPWSDRPLAPGETLARVIRAGSGVLVTSAGLRLGFQNGRLEALGGADGPRLTASALRDLTSHYAPLEVPNLPAGMQVWVPRRLPVPTRGPAPGPVDPRLVAAAQAQTRPPPAPAAAPLALASGRAGAAEAEQAAASLAGSKAAELMKPHDFGADAPKVRDALKEAARLAARTAYLSGRTQGMTPTQAREAANRAAQAALQPAMKALAEAAALRELETRVQDGRVFNRLAMNPRALAVLEAFEAGRLGAEARAWAVRLAGKSERQVRALMKLEVQAGRATEKKVALTSPVSQVMSVWEMPDGTVVRLKPLGDVRRPGPTLSVELKIDPTRPDADQSGIALKLDSRGRAVPRNLNDAQRPFTLDGVQDRYYSDACMDLGHREL
jgi:hypothetical protein